MSENTDYETLIAERDSALNTCSLIAEALGITGAVAGDTIAKVQQLVAESAALKAENCIQDFIIAAVKDLVRESDGVTGWHRNDDVATWDEVLPELSHSETPATNQMINEIKAQGVDEWIASRNGRWNGTTKEAEKFAASLRGNN
ncbi:hypothetical protein [Yersinia aleksiciae]|uniref:hypothetical protein n=1 Tax=Yersinia aleksiciae TaxID=263819 RepID=UPI001427C28C|nr:hypothetical protein [Yersinia aleksiciae]MDA5496903.1 hypothetical protein [Yersinia aleksiciae]NIK98715.1 hypothetical protein [Yersinia aleksiciae]WQC72370.1 hypothetical protein N0K21_08155 [Yersinia aleksiciae]